MRVNAYYFVGHIAAALLLLSSASALAQSTAEAGTPPFLYVVVAEEGKIKKKGDDYVLKLDKDDIEHVLEISEKPFKLKNYISADELVRTWQEGAGDFGGATMKATILSEDGAIPAVNLKSITKTSDKMEFVFILDGNASVDLDKFRKLDEVTVVNYCCHPEGGGGEWLWGGK